MGIYQDCTCAEYGKWTEGINKRRSGGFSCTNCSGEVNPNLFPNVQVIIKPAEPEFCNCGIPLGLDFRLVCQRCSLPVSTSRKITKTESRESGDLVTHKVQKKGLGPVGWTALIFLVSALIGGLLTMNENPGSPDGYIEEGIYEQSDGMDSFVGTP